MSMKMKAAVAAVSAAAMALTLGACGTGSNGGSASGKTAVSYSDVEAALKSDKDINLTMWAWSYDTMKPSVEAFEKKYPHIKIDFKSTGASADHYTKVQNAIKAKKGLPDIVQLEYDALPQYAVQGALVNLNGDGIDSNIGKLYNDAAWKNVHVGDGLYGIPQDQAPIAAWYRTDILDQYGIKIPTT
nr:extracellular solute-binding protein [uncultured Bifidobacterium sp.]